MVTYNVAKIVNLQILVQSWPYFGIYFDIRENIDTNLVYLHYIFRIVYVFIKTDSCNSGIKANLNQT